MTWLYLVLGGWVAVAIPIALLVGRAIRIADRRAAEAEGHPGSADVVVTEALSAEAPLPRTPSAMVPFRSTRWGPRRRPPVVRSPVLPGERNPSHRDSGVS